MFLFGHSMGSLIGLAYLTRHADGLAGGVLCAIPANVDDVGSLATLDFYRVRIGVGKPGHTGETVNWVLDRLPKDAAEALRMAEEEAGDAALSIIHEGLDRAMNRHNTRAEK